MINLQVCIPYQKCPFKCPMCIADNAPHFNNLYKENETAYFAALDIALKNNNIRTVVLTGDTEPTLDYEWMNKVINFIKTKYPKVSTELQTHVYRNHYLSAPNLGRICFSLTTVKDIEFFQKAFSSYLPSKVRMVILATGEVLDYLINNHVEFSCDQITFKLLQYTAYEQEEKDSFITNHRVAEDDPRLAKLVLHYGATAFNRSIVVDTNCQDSIGRYRIFREDGNVYLTWESLEKE